MQNLTARYNVLYNARILTAESERNLMRGYRENYNRLLPVFRESDAELAQPELKKLDQALSKMYVIINEKSQSKFVDDAYFLVARINHLKGDFFTSSEFFDYIVSTYPENDELRQTALSWKARALYRLGRIDEAKSSIDTALKYLSTDKSSRAGIFGVAAQLAIHEHREPEATELLEKAIKASDVKNEKLRWYYLLGQLQEYNGQPEKAFDSYNAVIKSNAPFELAFNARLNRLAIEDKMEGHSATRVSRLLALLKDEKNAQFADQIYYEIAKNYLNHGDKDQAIANFGLAAKSSVANKAQKGLAYLSLADIYFEQGNYARSKVYYDSTLLNLDSGYPEYRQIQKKRDNLDLLSDRLALIAREDSLQVLGRLPEKERQARIGALTRAQAREALELPVLANVNNLPNSAVNEQGPAAKFYFNNPGALSQGFSDFRRRWGNRKLEDSWRRSQRSAAEATNSPATTALNPDALVAGAVAASDHTDVNIIRVQDIPVTATQVAASNERIARAYMDIANFYKDILNEPSEAIKSLEELLGRFPDTPDRPAIYYNLYRLNSGINQKKADEYKKLLLKEYADSDFARIIQDPNFKKVLDKQEQGATLFYQGMYDEYLKKDYNVVIEKANQAKVQFSNSRLAPQIAYLGALALGHTVRLPAFETALADLVRKYPDDRMVVPLAEQHLMFIAQNRGEFEKRATALADYDPLAPRFVEEPESQMADVSLPEEKPEPSRIDEPAKSDNSSGGKEKPSLTGESSLFARSDTSTHYFVVNVLDARVNLNSSRFGIGQFNRSNFSGNSIKHRLKIVNKENQLIFVGEFPSKDAAANYYNKISPLMRDIMKIPADKYSAFIITEENLDKLNDRSTVEKYIEFYQTNY